MPAIRAGTRPMPWLGFLPGLFVGVVALALVTALVWVLLAR